MKQQYLIRLDDACPTMDKGKWSRMECLLDDYKVRPMVGIVPDNHDDKLVQNQYDVNFWDKVKRWQNKGWVIAMHGYDHCYISESGMRGLNPMWSRSEFAGVPFEQQREKIRKGVEVMRVYGIDPEYFFAPSHTFDENTLKALRLESNIRIISDTIGCCPYKKDDFWFIPQIAGHCVKMPFSGVFTFCFHPNTMDDEAFDNLKIFLNRYCNQFISFSELKLENYGKKRFMDKILSLLFFNYRKIIN